MSISKQTIIMNDEASKIFVFDKVHGFDAAKNKAEKRKLNAFGKLARVNIINRPKVSTVHLVREESRLEPFWYVESNKTVDYDHHSTYQIDIPNPYVQSVEIEGQTYEVARNKDDASVSMSALEKCYRKIYYNTSLDGLNRYIDPDAFIKYSEKFKFNEITEISASQNIIQPLLSQVAVIQQACTVLNEETLKAHEMHRNTITFDKVHLFLVPVFAFEFEWQSGEKTGVIEVNGLTGDVKEGGEWYEQKMSELIIRDMSVKTSSNLDDESIVKNAIDTRSNDDES